MSIKLKKFTFYWLPLIVYCLFVYIQSDYPSPESLPSFDFSDKLYHLAGYAVMGVLFYRAYQTLPFKDNIQLLVLFSMISATFYGISDEIHQSFVPYRDGNLLDVIADFLGAVGGVYLFNLWATAGKDRRRRYLKSEVGMRKAILHGTQLRQIQSLLTRLRRPGQKP
jgi:VanZ family protein